MPKKLKSNAPEMLMSKCILLFMTLFVTLLSTQALANGAANAVANTDESKEINELLCPDSKLISGAKIISSVCWSGIFPIYLGGSRIAGKKKYAPSMRADKTFCNCEKGLLSVPGLTTSLFLPTYMVTLTSKPYCFPELGGVIMSENLGLVNRLAIGNQDLTDGDEQGLDNDSDYQFHFAAYPVMRILNSFKLGSCMTDSLTSFDYLWLSETLPFWDGGDPELLSILTPEAVLLSNPLAWGAIIYDCVVSSLDESSDKIFFGSGCQGSMFPLSGETSDPSKESSMSLIANRSFFFVSRIGQLNLTAGKDALCKPVKMPLWKKSTYRIQKMWPMAELKSGENEDCFGGAGPGCDTSREQVASVASYQRTTVDRIESPDEFDPAADLTSQISSYKIGSLNDVCTHPVGQTTLAWGEWRTAGARGSDFASYLYFQWKDCCLQFKN